MSTVESRWGELLEQAESVVRDTIRRLPSELRVHAEKLPVRYEARPASEVIDDGEEAGADLLGLFVGQAVDSPLVGEVELPAQIILYLENLREIAGPDEAAFKEEVQVTYLHELGHYLGLDEEDLWERGLE